MNESDLRKTLSSTHRPPLEHWLSQLVHAFVEANPSELGHIKSENIIFVSGAARRTHRASIRPLRFPKDPSHKQWRKPLVTIDGKDILYEICLRPLYFLDGDCKERIRTIGHELWHISKSFDGTLDEKKRHQNVDLKIVEEATDALFAALHPIPPEIIEVLSKEGELTLTAWKIRPPSRIPVDSKERIRFTESDLYDAIIVQKNRTR